jgi:hypothetical protein
MVRLQVSELRESGSAVVYKVAGEDEGDRDGPRGVPSRVMEGDKLVERVGVGTKPTNRTYTPLSVQNGHLRQKRKAGHSRLFSYMGQLG